ncbi:SMI1/KNR4 family protein [Diaphorobacter ruginosibacter]|nr:SMI1/KNR4 family protein [Diaphorobacter ruginosibacter]
MGVENEDLPPLCWPDLPDASARSNWYRLVIAAYADSWEGHPSAPRIAPAPEASIAECEARIGCELPEGLARYHREFGALGLSETLCSVSPEGSEPIQPLIDAYPGLAERELSEEEQALAEQMVAFSDYLGNGNMFCFHRETKAVWYFDHDADPALTLFSAHVPDYLDALMLKMLAEVHDEEEKGEALLVEKFGKALVRKWMY